MNKNWFIGLIAIGTLFSLFNAFGISMFFSSPATLLQAILLVIAIILVVALIKNKDMKVLMWIFLVLHILAAGFQVFVDLALYGSTVVLSIVEVLYYGFLLFAYLKLLKLES